MHYWNRDNFEGLRQIGREYLSDKSYEGFANYCLLRDRGFRKDALDAINAFVASLEGKSKVEQREIAVELASLGFSNQHIHQLLPFPVRCFVEGVFENWVKEDRNDATPFRWLGYLRNDLAFFEEAVEIDPNDQISVLCLAQSHLDDVEFQTHHLSESDFLGDIADARSSLEHAERGVTKLSSKSIKDELLRELHYHQTLVAAWENYIAAYPGVSFPDWSKSIGYDFRFSSIAYYDDG